MTVARHKTGDYRPYVYRTADFGSTWTRIDAGMPAGEFCRVIREDPKRQGLLYVGTELGPPRVVRRRRGLAAAAVQPAGHARLRPRRQGRRPRRRHARPLVLDPRRPHAAAPAARRVAHRRQATCCGRATRCARHRTSPPRGAVRPGGKNYHPTSGQNATFYVEELETGHVRKRVIDAGDDLEPGVRITYFLDEAAVGDAIAHHQRGRRHRDRDLLRARSPRRRRTATGCTSPPPPG